MEKIKIYINGKEKEINQNSTIQNLLDELKTKSKMFVVELNAEIVPKEQYQDKVINLDDKIEIVSFFGGG